MKLKSSEFYDIMKNFEGNFSHMRLDKEPEELWNAGVIYQDGEVNNVFYAFRLGYSLGRLVYMNE